jgi:AcrR family transcriptional regulator
MAEVVTERGLAAATVATVVARAGVSRRTFCELFADREECFIAAFDHASGLAAAAVRPEYERPGSWRERIRAGLTAEGVVGAVLAVIHARLVVPTGCPMVELLGPLMNMIVLPYQGVALPTGS